jgi:glycosyltransferase involved in cell wall biosynthesis
MSGARVCLLNYHAWGVLADAGGRGVHIGGEEVQHALLARHLAACGWHVTSVVGDFGQQALEQVDGVAVRKTYAPGDGVPGLRFFAPRLPAVWRALAAAGADTYYTSCAGPMAGVLAAFCRRHRRRFVFRIASDADCTPSTLMLGNVRDRLLYRHGLRRADVVLVQTARQASLLERHYGVQARQAGMFCALPASVAPFAARAADLLWLANLRAMKRPEWFVDIARQVPRLRCQMAGAAHPDEAALYRRVAEAAAGLPNLQFHGQVRLGATGALFANARLFINTSAFEGFPNTYWQAWAHGVPVLATFDPDGLIAAHGLGLVVESPAAAGAAARALLADPAAWAACSVRCRQFATARLAPARVAAPYLDALAVP